MARKKRSDLPALDQLKQELDHEKYRKRYRAVVFSTIYILLAVAAAAVLISTLVFPVLRIYGSSMTPTFREGDLVVALKGSRFQRGDIISFYYNNKILVKRVIALEGEWVDLDAEGNVFINGEQLDEPYLTDKAFGECDIELPYQVPDDRVFVMGDHRATSADSRSTAVGSVFDEQIVGKIIFCVWPLSGAGIVK